MAVRVGINGFGRIGRNVFRSAVEGGVKDIEFVAVNDLTDAKTLAHLLRYDSNFGILPFDVSVDGDSIVTNGRKLRVFAQRDPAMIPWADLGVDVVLESTGIFRDAETTGKHITAGAKKVIISAPAKGDIPTFVLGVNEQAYDKSRHHIVSNASCTTNCIAPVVKVILDNFGVKKGLMTTIHSYTNDQSILDLPHKDLRRARAAAISMIPTTTGAAKAVGLVMPELKGKLDGLAIRVPTSTVSIVDVVLQVEKTAKRDAINNAFRQAANGRLKGILGVSDEPLVSVDYKKCPLSSIVDAEQTFCIDDMVKVLSWYDNEWGYSSRVVDLIRYMMK
jgi:glyceraldehyde 3-phosphate dehydrogenase